MTRFALVFGLAAVVTACSSRSPEAVPVDALTVDSPPVVYTDLVAFSDTYQGTGGGNLTSCNAQQQIIGYVPVGAGAAPVFIYLAGTGGDIHGGDVDIYLRGAAAAGFVAAAFSYDAMGVGDCAGVTATNRWAPVLEKPKCMFDTGPAGPKDSAGHDLSALGKLCSRQDLTNHVSADCSKGVVVMGHSQGGFIAMLAHNFDTRVQAAVGLADSNKGDIAQLNLHFDFANCVDDPSKNALTLRTLDKSRLLLIHGANDSIATLGPGPDRLDYIQAISGGPASCGPSCLSSTGAGYYIVQPGDLLPPSQQGSQNGHCFYQDPPTDCGTPYSQANAGFDPNWLGGHGPASASAAGKFLTQFVTR